MSWGVFYLLLKLGALLRSINLTLERDRRDAIVKGVNDFVVNQAGIFEGILEQKNQSHLTHHHGGINLGAHLKL